MRLALGFIELAVVILLTCIVISQIVLPAIRGTKMFPRFRREAKLRGDILDANQRHREADLEQELRERGDPLAEPSATASTEPTQENKQ